MCVIRSSGLYHPLDRQETIRNGTFLEKLVVCRLVKIFLWLSKPSVDHSVCGRLTMVPIRFPESPSSLKVHI